MKKQSLLFAPEQPTEPKKYHTGIEAPIYEPKNARPPLIFLCDDSKTRKLIREIDQSGLPEDEKQFLRMAAWRHAVFNYEQIADYYAHASAEMQKLMERSALVIIDFDAAIEGGFVKLCNEIRQQYYEEYKGPADVA